MLRRTLLVLAALLAASPALAKSLTSQQVGEIFCAARLSGDMAPVMAILSPDLAAIVAKALPADADAATAIPWQSNPDYANTCQSVGASGTVEQPEIVLAFGFREADKAQYADRLLMRFIDDRLRINDIAFSSGGTLRERLAGK